MENHLFLGDFVIGIISGVIGVLIGSVFCLMIIKAQLFFRKPIKKKYTNLPKDLDGIKKDITEIIDNDRPIKDDELIKLIQDRVMVVESFKELDNNSTKLQIFGSCLVICSSEGSRRIHKLQTNIKEKPIHTLTILFSDSRREVYDDKHNLKFPYGDFMKWFYSTDKPFYEFRHSEGFTIFLRKDIKSIDYRKK